MKEENYQYIIYKVQNKDNNMVYIGATTDSIHRRKLDHVERANRGESGKFQEAISTYGANAFNWKQIDTASSIDELAQLEQKYVSEYNSKIKGYNNSIGGEFKKTVYQYSLVNGSLINSYTCLTDACNAINATKQDISRACLSVNKTYGGYLWSYELSDNFPPKRDKRRKVVIQSNLNGNLIAQYASVAEASRQTGMSKTCISRVCRGEREHSGGFKWSYE